MSLLTILENDSEPILAQAVDVLGRCRLEHYEEAGPALGRERLTELYRLTVSAIRDRNLAPVIDYMTQVADDRYHAGYTIREVQIAINVLEEAIWHHVVQATPPDELAESLGLVSTVLGAAKDSLARAYVSLASQTKAPSLDLSALFDGQTSG
jgi:hypothetical protein